MRNSVAASYAVFIKRPDVKSEMHKMTRCKRKIVCSWFLPLTPYRWLFAVCARSRGNWQCRLILMSEFINNKKKRTPRSVSHNWSVIFVFHCRPAVQKRFSMAFIKSYFPAHFYATQSEPDPLLLASGLPSWLWKHSSICWLPLEVKPPKPMVS